MLVYTYAIFGVLCWLCQMCLGYETDSLDLDGEVIKEMPLAEISKQQLEKAVTLQVPS